MANTYVSVLFALITCGATGACASDEDEIDVGSTYDPAIKPDDFPTSTTIDNPLMPLLPGAVYTYKGEDEEVEVSVSERTKVILGVTCVVVRDTVRIDGEIVEDTYDWFAQDAVGNVWYFGEDTKEYENGEVVSSEGAWEAGIDGAKPGIVMHAIQPDLLAPYRQEFYAGKAEDMALVVSLDESVATPFGTFDHCLKTREFTPLEPGVSEYKFYCKDVGLVLEVDVGSGERVELTQLSMP